MAADEERHSLAGYVVPGVGSSIPSALNALGALQEELNESKVLCRLVVARLLFVRDELSVIQGDDNEVLRDSQVMSTYTAVIASTLAFFENHSRKNVLSRLASGRRLYAKVQEIHAEIDLIFKQLRLAQSELMSAWKGQWQQDQTTQRELMRQLVNDASAISSELRDGALVDALTELKYEVECHGSSYAPEYLDLMRETLTSVESAGSIKIPAIPKWFVPGENVQCPDEYFGSGSFGSVHRGMLGKDTHVVIKRLFMESAHAQQSFSKELELWSQLDHPHVLKLYGGNHVASSLFFVCEDAVYGNFTDYFRDPDNRHNDMWRLFHEAALGLHYLHSKQVVHGELKCDNLLVGKDGLARVADFGLSAIRSQSVGLTITTQAETSRWLAPESLTGSGLAANPTFAADVYALGLSIIEIVTGKAPWETKSDDEILNSMLDSTPHPRPDGLAGKQWKLVQSLTRIDATDRIKLDTAIVLLKELAEEEAAAEKVWTLDSYLHSEDSFTKRLQEFLLGMSSLEHHEKQKLLDDVRKLEVALEKEAIAKQMWEQHAPTEGMCDVCGEVNPLDSHYCCDCGASIGNKWSAEKGWHKVEIRPPVNVEEAVASLEAVVVSDIGQPRNQCPSCGAANPNQQSSCSKCGSSTAAVLKSTPQSNSANTAKLRKEVDKLTQQLGQSDREAVIFDKEQQLQDKPCSRCGCSNPPDNVFCSDCGNDVEIIKCNKL